MQPTVFDDEWQAQVSHCKTQPSNNGVHHGGKRPKGCHLIHGRYDMVCPMEQAQLLYDQWPASELHIVRDAGHSQIEPGIIDNLVSAARSFAPKLG